MLPAGLTSRRLMLRRALCNNYRRHICVAYNARAPGPGRVGQAQFNGDGAPRLQYGERRSAIEAPGLQPPQYAARDSPEADAEEVSNATPVVVSVLTCVTVLMLGVGNRVLNRMALVPLQNYVFFLAQLQTFGYVAIYFTTLSWRYRRGIVTPTMMSIAKDNLSTLMFIGMLEALAQVLLFASAANLPGVILPILTQSLLLWQLGLSALFLNTRYSANQLLGAAAVFLGVCTAAWQSGAGAVAFDIRYVTLMVLGFAFPATAVILKDGLFKTAKQRLGGQSLDLFIVNSFGSLFQAIGVFFMLPIMAAQRGLALSQLGSYLQQGAVCFMGLQPTCGSDCTGAPLLPAMYVAANLAFNVSALAALRLLGAARLGIVMSALVPLNVWAFTFPLPFLGAAPALTARFFAGTGILILGMVMYNLKSIRDVLASKPQAAAV